MILIGLPPGGIFISEYTLFRAGFAHDQPWLMGAMLLLLTVVFGSFMRHLNTCSTARRPPMSRPANVPRWRSGLLLLNVAVLVTVLGLTLPAPLATLLNQSVMLVGR